MSHGFLRGAHMFCRHEIAVFQPWHSLVRSQAEIFTSAAWVKYSLECMLSVAHAVHENQGMNYVLKTFWITQDVTVCKSDPLRGLHLSRREPRVMLAEPHKALAVTRQPLGGSGGRSGAA